jgi:uncharacterized protein
MEAREKSSRPTQSTGQLMGNTHAPLEERHRTEHTLEDDYFRQHEHALLVTLRAQNAAEIEQAMRRYTRMRCPKCGAPLEETPCRQATMAACPECGGLWLDKGEWEGLVGSQAHGWLQRLFEGLMGSKHAKV